MNTCTSFITVFDYIGRHASGCRCGSCDQHGRIFGVSVAAVSDENLTAIQTAYRAVKDSGLIEHRSVACSVDIARQLAAGFCLGKGRVLAEL